MELNSFGYGYSGTLHLPFEEAIERTRQALAHHGFGVQAEISISQALKLKLGVDVPREVILGVCNPALALRAMQSEPHITVLLPCNVTVKDNGDHSEIAAADPRKLIQIASDPNLKDVAFEADKRLREALAEL
jgi:uncharacterized protein (DUF302 family)